MAKYGEQLAARPANLYDVPTGTECFALVLRPIGKRGERHEVTGIMRVRIVETHVDGQHNVTRVQVIAGGDSAGAERTLKRAELYVASNRDERMAFHDQVTRIWPSREDQNRSMRSTLPGVEWSKR